MKIVTVIAYAVLSFFAKPLWAESGEYQIELIVFSQNMPNTEVFEQTGSKIVWPANLYEPGDYKKIDQLTLSNSYIALSANPAYQPLLQTGWTQKIQEGVLSAPLHIRSPDGRINGFVLMQRTQALQLTIDLEYSPGADNIGNGLIYRLNESRQLKPDEVNYFDHPKFAVLAKILVK